MNFAQRILFAEDLIMFFMRRYQVYWNPGTNGKIWDGHPRRFTQEMGCVAWNLLPFPFSFDVDGYYYPIFIKGYNTKDFLQYCGFLGYMSVKECLMGRNYVVDGIVLSVVDYLGKIYQDGSFPASGGWDALAKSAEEILNKMKIEILQLQ